MRKYLICLLTGVLTMLLTLPAMAKIVLSPTEKTTITFYGAVPVQTFWYSYDQRTSGKDKHNDIYMEFERNARVGAILKYEKLTGHWEIGMPGDYNMYGNNAYTRLLYGKLDITSDLNVTIGQFYTPTYWWGNSSYLADNGAIGYGAAYDGRLAQLKLTYKGLYIDLAKPSKNKTFSLGADEDVRSVMPKIYGGYEYVNKNVSLGIGAAVNSFKAKSKTKSIDETITSPLLYGHGDVGIADILAFRFAGYYGRDVQEFGMLGLNSPPVTNAAGSTSYGSGNAGAVLDGTSIKHTKTTAGYGELRGSFGNITPRIGYGYAQFKNDMFQHTNKQQEYWLNATIPLYTGDTISMTVTPEVHIFDQMKDKNGEKEAKLTVAGAKWQVNF